MPVTENITFDKDIKPITSSVCIECHTSKGENWSIYSDAFSYRYRIYSRIVELKDMPMGKFLDEKDRALFRDWVNQGGKK